MAKITKFLISLTISFAIFLMLTMPALSLAAQDPAAGGLVPCDNSTGQPCDFIQLMNMVNIVIKFILYDMVIPIAAIMFAYAGFELVTSGGSTEKRGTAKKVFTNAVLGLIFAVAAFLIVRTILSILGYQGSWIGFNPL